jgi:hypothetical protein
MMITDDLLVPLDVVLVPLLSDTLDLSIKRHILVMLLHFICISIHNGLDNLLRKVSLEANHEPINECVKI